MNNSLASNTNKTIATITFSQGKKREREKNMTFEEIENVLLLMFRSQWPVPCHFSCANKCICRSLNDLLFLAVDSFSCPAPPQLIGGDLDSKIPNPSFRILFCISYILH